MRTSDNINSSSIGPSALGLIINFLSLRTRKRQCSTPLCSLYVTLEACRRLEDAHSSAGPAVLKVQKRQKIDKIIGSVDGPLNGKLISLFVLETKPEFELDLLVQGRSLRLAGCCQNIQIASRRHQIINNLTCSIAQGDRPRTPCLRNSFCLT